MKIKNILKSLFFYNTVSFSGLHAVNRYISDNSERTSSLKTDNGSFFKWKTENVFYTKTGSGSVPVLLLHDARSYSSSDEWKRVSELLAAKYNFTVYAPDLPGCGRSDKPGIKYTNYYYIQFITSFIKEVIGEPVVAVSSGLSSSFLFMTAHCDPELLLRIVALNPLDLKHLDRVPDRRTRFLCSLINIPVIGTSIYYFLSSRRNTLYLLNKKLFYDPFNVSSSVANMLYSSSHIGRGKGKYLMASIDGHYLYWNIRRFLPEIKIPVSIVCGDKLSHSREIMKEYRNLNSSFKGVSVPLTKMLVHMENPERVARIISS